MPRQKAEQKLDSPIQDMSPCKGCQDKTPGCHDRCPGYKIWRRELERVKANRKKYESMPVSKFN